MIYLCNYKNICGLKNDFLSLIDVLYLRLYSICLWCLNIIYAN